MKNISKLFKTIGALLFLGILLLSTGVSASAYTEIDMGKTGSITVSPETGQSIGTELTLFRVAEVQVDNADQKYVLTKDFKDSGEDLTKLDDTEQLAKALSDYVKEKGLSGNTMAAQEDGTVTFEDLPLGLYLIIQTVTRTGKTIVNPFLVSIPVMENEIWIYDVDASPKAETYELVDVTVKKVWNDGGDTAARPDFITVSIYEYSNLVDTVTLNSSSNWSYTWRGLDKSDGYSVSEEAVSGYEAAYSQKGNSFTITNTPKLVQTGQLNWPVPLLAVCGIIMFAAGWTLVFLKRKRDA